MADSSSGLSGSSMNGRTMFSGLMSGLDTESLVKAATINLKTSINSKKQQLQKLTWKQDAYRDVISKLSDFQSKYLDILSPSSIRANAVMNKYTSASTNEKLQVTASSGATPAEYKITYSQKATAAEIQGTKASEGSIYLDFSEAESGSNTVEITLDGSTKKVTFEGGANAKQNFLDAVNSTFKDITSTRFAFRDDSSNTDTAGRLILNTIPGDKVSHNFQAAYSTALGLDNNAYSGITKQSALGDVDFSTALDGDKFEFSINGVDFSFDRDSKISDVLNAVNKSSAGVTMSFSTLSQSFKITSNSTGAGQSIEISQSKGNLINSLFNVSDGAETGGISWGSSVSKPFIEQMSNGNGFTSKFEGEKGFSSNKTMHLTVNGYDLKLDLSALTEKQETEKITVNIGGTDKEIEAKVSQKADTKDKIYTYTDDSGSTLFIGADKKVAFSVDSDGKTVRDPDGNVIDDEAQYRDIMDASGFTTSSKVMHKFTAEEYANAYNDALNKAVAANDKINDEVTLEIAEKNGYNAETDGSLEDYLANMDEVDKTAFDMQKNQRLSEIALDKWGLKFSNTEADSEGNVYINLDVGDSTCVYIKRGTSDFGFNTEKNYAETAKAPTAVVSDKALTFINGEGRTVSITGSGENGEVKISDLLSYTDANGNPVFKYDQNDGTLTVAEGNTLTFADNDTRAFLNDVFGKTTIKGVSSSDTLTVYGTNAQVTINGTTLESADSTFTVDGTTFTFNNVDDFDAELDPDSAITVTTKKDNSSIKETVKNFVNDYNTLINDLYKQIRTSRPKDGKSYYDPLTEEQEDEMSDDEIEKWNEKAKEGWLYNDPSINKLINKVRGAMATSFNGMSLSDLGIKLKGNASNYSDPTLEIDESKLETAINRYGDDVAKFFTDSENGLANKLNNAIDAAISTKSTDGAGHKATYGYLTGLAGVKNTVSETKNQYYSQMQTIQKVIDTLQERYESQQERYWSKFTSLETYISNMSAQMSYFNSSY